MCPWVLVLIIWKLNQTPCSFLSPVCTKPYSLQASTWKTNVDEKNKAWWSQGHSKINESCLRVWISLCVLLHPVKPKYGRRRAEPKITSLLIYFIKINIILLIGIIKANFMKFLNKNSWQKHWSSTKKLSNFYSIW